LNDELFVAHAGDSRCYLRRDGKLHRLTRDHTLVAEMVRNGILSAGDAPQHRWRHVITNFVGGDAAEKEVNVELHKLKLASGDAILLCSDGLTEMLDDEEISRILQSDPEEACLAFVKRANDLGGRDNITAVVARFDRDQSLHQ
jgi:protein phosphatase